MPDLIRKWFQFHVRLEGRIWCRETYLHPEWIKQEIGVEDELQKLKKPELQKLLDDNKINYNRSMLKNELVQLVRSNNLVLMSMK